jgi:hypothetical protein
LVDELFRLFRHGNSLEEKKQKNDKISRKEGSRDHWKEKERESIDVKGLKNNSNWNKKSSSKKNIFGNYYF